MENNEQAAAQEAAQVVTQGAAQEVTQAFYVAVNEYLNVKGSKHKFEAPHGGCPGAPEKHSRIEQQERRWGQIKKASKAAARHLVKLVLPRIIDAASTHGFRMALRIIDAMANTFGDDKYAAGRAAEAWEGGKDQIEMGFGPDLTQVILGHLADITEPTPELIEHVQKNDEYGIAFALKRAKNLPNPLKPW
jgi:hypothetical protein